MLVSLGDPAKADSPECSIGNRKDRKRSNAAVGFRDFADQCRSCCVGVSLESVSDGARCETRLLPDLEWVEVIRDPPVRIGVARLSASLPRHSLVATSMGVVLRYSAVVAGNQLDALINDCVFDVQGVSTTLFKVKQGAEGARQECGL